MATGIRQRHGRGCNAKGHCKCPYEAFVYSKRDGKKIRKTSWTGSSRAVRARRRCAPVSRQSCSDSAGFGRIQPESCGSNKPETGQPCGMSHMVGRCLDLESRGRFAERRVLGRSRA